MIDYYNPVNVIESDNWFNDLKQQLKKEKVFNSLIVATHGSNIRLKLESKFYNSILFSDFKTNPDFDDCNSIIKLCKKNEFDSVIAIGGGSAMDIAKVAIAYISTEKEDIYELINTKDKYKHKISSFFLPTTHGTASEVTMWGTLWNNKEKKKYSISNKCLYPTVAILDASLALSLPYETSIITTLDALSHSFEAIWNKNATEKTNTYAIRAICLILSNVEKLYEFPFSLNTRKKLLKSSMIAGLAFSNTATAAAHSISYPLTLHYDIPHGIASSISLIPLLRINSKKIEKSLNQIYSILGIVGLEDLIDIIKRIPVSKLKYSLSDWGVKKNDLNWLVEKSYTKERMENNIVDLTKDDVSIILNQIF